MGYGTFLALRRCTDKCMLKPRTRQNGTQWPGSAVAIFIRQDCQRSVYHERLRAWHAP